MMKKKKKIRYEPPWIDVEEVLLEAGCMVVSPTVKPGEHEGFAQGDNETEHIESNSDYEGGFIYYH